MSRMANLLAILMIWLVVFPLKADALSLGNSGSASPLPYCDYCGKNRQGKVKKDTGNAKRFVAPSRGLSIPPKKNIGQQNPDAQKEKNNSK